MQFHFGGREGRKEGGHMKLTDLETEKRGGGERNHSYGPEKGK